MDCVFSSSIKQLSVVKNKYPTFVFIEDDDEGNVIVPTS